MLPESGRRAVRILVIWLVAVCGTQLGIATEGNRRPNILLIITDQQHAGMLSCAGKSLSADAPPGLAGSQWHAGSNVPMPAILSRRPARTEHVHRLDAQHPGDAIQRRGLPNGATRGLKEHDGLDLPTLRLPRPSTVARPTGCGE